MKEKNKENILPQEMIERLFPEKLPTLPELEKKYPPRELPEGAMVTRVGPSPTGFMHIGGVYAALVSERLAHQSGGVFYLRIEDTDQERSKSETIKLITNSLETFGIPADEGMSADGEEKGKYGPYTQSARADIYKAFVKKMLEEGKAYLCFESPEEREKREENQKADEARPGYYGKYATWRDAPVQKVKEKLDAGVSYAVRFRSEGNFNNKIPFHDILKGDLELSENDVDAVLYKSSTGLPTYHMAHVVDDHLMGTTHVLRGDEWLSSAPLHVQLFEALGWKPPEYGHIAPIQKMEENSKRKISKRKDPEANAMLYVEKGYPPEAVVEYLLNLANSNFEEWRKENPEKDSREFEMTTERLSHSSGPLFDFTKLNDISSNVISRFSAEEVYSRGLEWAKSYHASLAAEMEKDPDYAKKIFGIERTGVEQGRVRKDIIKWEDLPAEISYFYDALFEDPNRGLLAGISEEDRAAAVEKFLPAYDENDDKDAWFGKVKAVAKELGYAESAKEFKKGAPRQFKGQVGDIAKIFRVLLTGKTNTPDLHSIMKVMGRERVEKRLKKA